MKHIVPVILCGGSGTRLWPLSRQSFPKQFTRLSGEHTLFQASALRLHGQTGQIAFDRPMVLTNADFRFIVGEQLLQVGIDPGPILIEPEGRNTAPAILAAALQALDRDPDSILLVCPSDHVIPDTAQFHAAIAHGLDAVAQGRMVTFGVTPDRPETGYGYLELSEQPEGQGGPIPLKRFVEKPDLATATGMLRQGRYVWNAGIFLFAAKDILAAFDRHAADLLAPVRSALQDGQTDLGFLRLAPAPWARARNISIDYAVMEKSDNLSVVSLASGWSDLGSWDAVHSLGPADRNGTVTTGPANAIDCRDSLLRSESADLELVGIGLENICVIATPDAVLVADMARAQDVGQAVKLLNTKGAYQAHRFTRDHRPWGHFETLAQSSRFQVKRIVVKPGAALSLQSHVHRSEHWIVVAGTARVTIGETEKLVTENESVYIPLGARHRLSNPGKLPMVLIEVQTGAYLGEDDIVRYEDIYARTQDDTD